jgi:hypothetical protein
MSRYPKTPHGRHESQGQRVGHYDWDGTVEDARTGKDAVTPLLFASMKGKKDDVLDNLLVNGLNVNQSQGDGWTALHYSVNAGHQDVINLLALWCALHCWIFCLLPILEERHAQNRDQHLATADRADLVGDLMRISGVHWAGART